MVFWWCATLYSSTWHRSYPYITTLWLTLLPGPIILFTITGGCRNRGRAAVGGACLVPRTHGSHPLNSGFGRGHAEVIRDRIISLVTILIHPPPPPPPALSSYINFMSPSCRCVSPGSV